MKILYISYNFYYTYIIQEKRFYIGSKSAFTSQNGHYVNSPDNILFLWTEEGAFPDCPNQNLPEINWKVQQWDKFPKKVNGPNGKVTWNKISCHCNYPVISIWHGDSCNTGYAGSKCESCADEYYMDDGKCKGMF